MRLEFSTQIFEKYSNIRFHENPSNGSLAVASGRTDRQTLIYWPLFAMLRISPNKKGVRIWCKVSLTDVVEDSSPQVCDSRVAGYCPMFRQTVLPTCWGTGVPRRVTATKHREELPHPSQKIWTFRTLIKTEKAIKKAAYFSFSLLLKVMNYFHMKYGPRQCIMLRLVYHLRWRQG